MPVDHFLQVSLSMSDAPFLLFLLLHSLGKVEHTHAYENSGNSGIRPARMLEASILM